MPLKRIFISLLILLLGAVAVAMIASNLQTRKQEDVKAQQEQTKKDNVTGESVTFTVTEGAHKKWTINAKQAVYFTDNSGATLKNIEGTFFSKEGKPVMTFTAPSGEYRTKDHKVDLAGGVKATAAKSEETKDVANAEVSGDMSLTAPKMSWSSRSDEVVAEGGVVMKQGKGESRAQRCRFNLTFTKIELEGGVRSAMSL